MERQTSNFAIEIDHWIIVQKNCMELKKERRRKSLIILSLQNAQTLFKTWAFGEGWLCPCTNLSVSFLCIWYTVIFLFFFFLFLLKFLHTMNLRLTKHWVSQWMVNLNCLERLGNASSMASGGSLLVLFRFAFPDVSNILCYSHGVTWSTREPSPCEPDCIESGISFPALWEWLLWESALGEKFTFL